ncbi:MAG: ribbon-helix-helix protein, CopG family [Xanthomonadales bacterium]|nr:Antitoxin VapB33 [Xanthomonadales bacterium]MCC6592807.1 ribbon-helix-helix protein, CopG family [Xanthomonadales bacterium]MCE7931690.1 ribbon-helix-helix protein, CopG family [Xanthomonadales bacterium PRO6]
MRTTLTLDDDVVALLDRAGRERGQSFKQLVNDAIRRGLAAAPQAQVAQPLPVYSLRTQPGVDLTRALQLAAELEDEALLAKQALGK